MKLQELKNNSILILGFGQEGKDTLQFLHNKFPNKQIGIADQNKKTVSDKNVDTYFGDNYLQSIQKYDIIIKSPGIPIQRINTNGKIITSQSDIFLNLVDQPVIGVTGTKGKSTTCQAIYKILKENGYSVNLVGNMGRPALTNLNNKGVFIYELSSFQLQTVSDSPDISILLNIYKDHLDHHKTFEEYQMAKSKITQFQDAKDKLIYNKDNQYTRQIAQATEAKKIPFDPTKKLDDSVIYQEPILKTVELLGVSQEKAKQVLQSFNQLTHRLEHIGEFQKINFYNDSAATIPEATIAAINYLGENLTTLITGGVNKGGNYEQLSRKIIQSTIKNLILFPESGIKIKQQLERQSHNLTNISIAQNMEEAVQKAYNMTKKDTTCLLSPASSSFNMFNDYKHRGELFEKYVKKYGKQ